MKFVIIPTNPLLKSATLQTLLASLKPRKFFKTQVIKNSQLILLKLKNSIRLTGFYTERPNPKGFLILLHGWEGSANSGYILNTANFFYEKGYSIFRLNFKDHGETHHLNDTVFNGDLLDEVYLGTEEIINQCKPKVPVTLVGFSLGGSYAARLSVEYSKRKNKKIKHFFAVSPAVHPENTTIVMDKDPFLRNHFLSTWKKSLTLKAKLFPFLYNFSKYENEKTVYNLTERLVTDYGKYKSASEYFNAYKLKIDFAKDLKIPLLIITANDDPVCKIEDFIELKESKFFELLITDRGGHNGFFLNFNLECYYHQLILSRLE